MKKRGKCARRTLHVVGGLLLALCSSVAMALGLGDIQVLSRPGQPLLAEIPVISNEPSELEQVRVALASPETFARVGLQRPKGLAEDLQFVLTQNANGRAVIRVTSRRPVEQAALGFLIEVNWGKGRLVREYSALVNAPSNAVALDEPIIEVAGAKAGDGTDVIARADAAEAVPPAAVAVAASTQADKPQQQPQPQSQQKSTQAAAKPQQQPQSQSQQKPQRQPTPQAAEAARAQVAVAEPGNGVLAPVRQGQTLWQVASELTRDNDVTVDQAMLALWRTNPDAFINGNINLIKQGAVLRTPEQHELDKLGAAEATALVLEQHAQWRQARKPVAQPVDGGAIPVTPAAAADKPQLASATAVEPAAAVNVGARLEIAPAVAADADTAGTTSGISAGGEGDMLADKQLQQAREDVATRDAEIKELRARVEDLEKIHQQQLQLIAMKDENLAKAQQKLAAIEPGSDSSMWLWWCVVLVVVGTAGWLMARRRKPSPLPPRHKYEFDMVPQLPVDAEVNGGAAAAEVESVRSGALHEEEATPAVATVTEDGSHKPEVDDALSMQAAMPDELPVVLAEPEPEPEPELELEQEPEQEPFVEVVAAPVSQVTSPEPAAEATHAKPAKAWRDRLELAIAYYDLGDPETARRMLEEVIANGDAEVRAEAAKFLDRIDLDG